MSVTLEGAWSRFEDTMRRAQEAGELYRELVAQHPENEERYVSLLRWEWVAGVSALDKLVHDLVLAGILQIFQNRASQAGNLLKPTQDFMDLYLEIFQKKRQEKGERIFEIWPFPEEELLQAVSRKHKTQSFQKIDAIANALACIWPNLSNLRKGKNQSQPDIDRRREKLSEILYGRMPQTVQDRYREERDPCKAFRVAYHGLMQRRDQIVHQGDYNDDELGFLTKEEVDNMWNIMHQMGTAIYEETVSIKNG